MSEPPYRPGTYEPPWPPPQPPIPPPPPRRPPSYTGLRRLTAAVAAAVVLGFGITVWALSGNGGESGQEVSRESFQREGKPWPLTVDHARVDCEQGSLLTLTAPNGVKYGLNGTAQDRLHLPSIKPIWREDPEFPGLGIGVSPDGLFVAARAEC